MLRDFAFRLALQLGQINPEAMMRRLPWRIFAQWMEYAQREPFGEWRADLRAGRIAAILAHAFGGEKMRGVTAATFFPELEPFLQQQTQEKTPDMIYQQLAALTMAMGGEIIHKEREVDA